VVKVPSGYSIWVVGTPEELNFTQTLAFIVPDPSLDSSTAKASLFTWLTLLDR
jgi:hypothetical protein